MAKLTKESFIESLKEMSLLEIKELVDATYFFPLCFTLIPPYVVYFDNLENTDFFRSADPPT